MRSRLVFWALACVPVIVALLLAYTGSMRKAGSHVQDVTCVPNHDLLLWSTNTGEQIRSFSGHTDSVDSIVFDRLGKRIASGSLDGTVRSWAVRTGQALLCLRGHTGGVLSVVFSHDGNLIASGGQDGTVRIWNADTGQELHCLYGHEFWVDAVAFTLDGRYVASGSYDGSVKVWDVATGKELRTFRQIAGQVTTVVFTTDGKRMMASGKNIFSPASPGRIAVWDVATWEELPPVDGIVAQVESFALDSSGTRMAYTFAGFDSSGKDLPNQITLWDICTSRPIFSLTGHHKPVYRVIFSDDGGLVVSGSEDSTVKVWDAETGRLITTFRCHTGYVCGVAISPNGVNVVSSGN